MQPHISTKTISIWATGVMRCWYCVFVLNVVVGCASADDPQTLALIEKHIPAGSIHYVEDEHGAKWIASLSIPNKRSALEVLPHLGKLPQLETLKVGYKGLADDDLKALPSLPNLKMLGMGQTLITDEALKYLAGMKNLERLRISQTQVRGPGLAHLKEFSKLTWLELGSTPLDDSAMPHIAANFPRLEKLSLGNTKVTPDGLMKLVDLHWLQNVGTPNDIIGPNYRKAKTDLERNRMRKERFEARIQFFGKFRELHTESKRKARAAGIEVPPDSTGPFGSSWYTYQRLQKAKDQEKAAPKVEDARQE